MARGGSSCVVRRLSIVAVRSLVILAVFSGAAPVAAETSNRIVAIVNDDVITDVDVATHLSVLLQGAPDDPQLSPYSSGMQREALLRLIEQQLMLQEARRMELSVRTDDVADRLNVMRGRFDSEQEFRESLMEAQMTKEQLKDQIREQLLVTMLIDGRIRSKITVSPQEVAQEVALHPEADESNELRDTLHILVRVTEARDEQETRALIERVHVALEDGADFHEMAREYSDDPNAEQGGAMGWVGPGTLMPELDAHLFSLEEGAFSAPIQTRLGFHIIMVAGRRAISKAGALEAKRAIERDLFQRKFEEAFVEWLDQLKRRAYIEVRPLS